MQIRSILETKLREAFTPLHLQLTNESHQHNVPPGSESHWNMVIVSAVFNGLSLVQRQQAVYTTLSVEMRETIHALTMKTLTPEEWQEENQIVNNVSPPCRGGSAH